MRYAIVLCLCAAALCGCATPPEALSVAQNSTSMISQLEVQLARFRAEQTFASQQRLDIVRDERSVLLKVSAINREIDIAAGAAGEAESPVLLAKLKKLAEDMQAADLAAQTDQRELDAALAKLLAPLPETQAGTGAAKKALGALAVELDAKTRLAEFKVAFDAIKQTVEDLQKQAEQ